MLYAVFGTKIGCNERDNFPVIHAYVFCYLNAWLLSIRHSFDIHFLSDSYKNNNLIEYDVLVS